MLKYKSESGDLSEILEESGRVYFDDNDSPIKDLSQVWYVHNNVRKLVWENSITLTLPDGMNRGVADTTLYPEDGFDVWDFIVTNNPHDFKNIYVKNPSGQKIGRVNFSIPAGYNVTFINDGEIFGYPNTAALFLYSPAKIINNGVIYGGGGTGGTGGTGGPTNAITASGRRTFTSNGTFVVPPGVTSVHLCMVGAGGDGAEVIDYQNNPYYEGRRILPPARAYAGGGWAGQIYNNYNYSTTPGDHINVIVGQGDTYFGNTKAARGKDGVPGSPYRGKVDAKYIGNGGSGTTCGGTGKDGITTYGATAPTTWEGPTSNFTFYGGQSSGFGNGGDGTKDGYYNYQHSVDRQGCDGGVGSGGGAGAPCVRNPFTGELLWPCGGGKGGRGEVRVSWDNNVPSVAGGAGGRGGVGIGWGSPATPGLPGADGSWNANHTAKSGAGGRGGTGGSWGQSGSSGETGATSSDGNRGTSGTTPTSIPYAVYRWGYAKRGSVLGNIVGGVYDGVYRPS